MSIRRLRLRRQDASLPNEVRQHRQAAIRLIYFAAVLLLSLWLGDLFLGSLFYLHSQGLVMAEPAVVAAEFAAIVRALPVHEGDRVAAGQIVAVVDSQSVAESMARLTTERTDQSLRLDDARIRGATVNAVLDLARTRRDIAADTRRRLELLVPAGFLPLEVRMAALDAEFRSREDLARLTAEHDTLTARITELSLVLAQTDEAVVDLRRRYHGGVLRAPIGGIVGRRLAENGTVVMPGQSMLELYDDRRFVRAFVPTGGLFAVSPGDDVVIGTGLRSFSGRITSLEPVAAALPPEFQHAFTPLDRQQVMRIDFDPGQMPPPLFAKVTVRSSLSWHVYLARLLGWPIRAVSG
jgi:multidrug resistance efflux pump